MRIGRENIELNSSMFDAVLDTGGVDAHTNAQLTITLKVFLRPNAGAPIGWRLWGGQIIPYGERPVSDLDGNRFMFRNFPPDNWRRFKEFYQSVGQEFWDGNFWLTSPESFINLDSRPEAFGHSATLSPQHVIHPAVDCHFRLLLVDNTADAHRTIDVYNIVRNLTPVETAPGSTRSFRADETHYDQHSIESATHIGDIGADDLMCLAGQSQQQTFLHEIGHAIGLDHVGLNVSIVGCFDVSDHNSTICYGNTYATRHNIMGAGENMSWAEALPWRRAMEVLTSTSRHSWEVHQNFVGPHEITHAG